MKVRAIASDGSLLGEALRRLGSIDASESFQITAGSEYTVYALLVFGGHAWYYIVDDDHHPWPVWHPWPLFEVADPRASKQWIVSVEVGLDDDHIGSWSRVHFAFPEWINQAMFYERLTSGEEPEISIFARYKTLMDREFD